MCNVWISFSGNMVHNKGLTMEKTNRRFEIIAGGKVVAIANSVEQLKIEMDRYNADGYYIVRNGQRTVRVMKV